LLERRERSINTSEATAPGTSSVEEGHWGRAEEPSCAELLTSGALRFPLSEAKPQQEQLAVFPAPLLQAGQEENGSRQEEAHLPITYYYN